MLNNEPVAWMIEKNGKQFFTEQSPINGFHGYDKIIPLYTHPVKELTEMQIMLGKQKDEIEALKAELEKSAEVNRQLAEDIGYEQ